MLFTVATAGVADVHVPPDVVFVKVVVEPIHELVVPPGGAPLLEDDDGHAHAAAPRSRENPVHPGRVQPAVASLGECRSHLKRRKAETIRTRATEGEGRAAAAREALAQQCSARACRSSDIW